MRDDGGRREEARSMLVGGLLTEVSPRADNDEIFKAIVDRIRASDRSLRTLLVLGGFTLEKVEHEGLEQLCETCMYYQVHRRYCDLPELDMPVEPEWSCRLWRI